jgi:hypothetical protein
MDPIDPNAVNDPAEPGIPAPEGQPLPGQSDPNPTPAEPAAQAEPGSEPMPGDPEPSQTVPLAALHEERNRRQELQAEVELLKQIAGDNVLFDINGKPVPQPQRQQETAQQPNQAAAELEKLWEEDPRKAVQVEIMAANAYRDQQQANVDAQMGQAAVKYSDFGQYDATVRQYIRALPLEQRAKPGVVDLAYYVVKGQNAGNAVEAAKAEMLRKIQAGENVQGLPSGTKPTPAPTQVNGLNEEQLRVADAMGLTPEQYQSAMVKK